ncbi:hypothetical protein SEPCBS119000_001384 [Sporothrix epigloea]|uniref:C3H1-type domain-containing protein n=1 Tax=Sporothrix epigloea TaxID=1892477 RepID=A0ABP0DDL4_9PEZI
MSSYGYGPPPPPPLPAQPSGAYGQQYQAPYQHGQSHGGHSHSRGGRGGGYYGGGRGGGTPGAGAGTDHQSRHGYGAYGGAQQYSQPAQYAHNGSVPSPYGALPQPPSSQQHWSPDPAGQHQPSPQAYYPPQAYQQQGPQGHPHTQHQPTYGQQPLYTPPNGTPAPPGPPSYGHQYQQQGGGYSHQWNASGSQPNAGHTNGGHTGHYGGRGRGGGYHHEQRGGGPKSHMMGPPIRIGFENGSSHGLGAGPPAPVSSRAYQPPPPPGPYGVPQGGGSPPPPPGPAGFGAPRPYQAYPPAGSPQHYDSNFNNSQNSRQYTRGGFHNGGGYRGGRTPYVDPKMRYNKKPGFYNNGPPGPHAAFTPNYHQKPDDIPNGKKKKRKTNTLGLTPGDESDEGEDEEAELVELIGSDAPNPVDIAAWIAERRSNFPTKERIKARLADSNGVGDKADIAVHPPTSATKSSAQTALERQQQKAEKLRRKLEKVESSIKRKREQQDEGDEMRDVEDDGAVSDTSLDSDDEAPETEPIHTDGSAVAAATVSAAAAKGGKSLDARKADPTKHCKYYSTGGTCGKKGKCRFVHDPAVREAALQERERNGGRITLKQRLVLNDKEQEDLTIIKTLQYLKEKGMMTVASKASSEDLPATDMMVETTVVDPTVSAEAAEPEPVAVADLPEAPSPTTNTETVSNGADPALSERYQGWDLSGFGNTGAEADETRASSQRTGAKPGNQE